MLLAVYVGVSGNGQQLDTQNIPLILLSGLLGGMVPGEALLPPAILGMALIFTR